MNKKGVFLFISLLLILSNQVVCPAAGGVESLNPFRDAAKFPNFPEMTWNAFKLLEMSDADKASICGGGDLLEKRVKYLKVIRKYHPDKVVGPFFADVQDAQRKGMTEEDARDFRSDYSGERFDGLWAVFQKYPDGEAHDHLNNGIKVAYAKQMARLANEAYEFFKNSTPAKKRRYCELLRVFEAGSTEVQLKAAAESPVGGGNIQDLEIVKNMLAEAGRRVAGAPAPEPAAKSAEELRRESIARAVAVANDHLGQAHSARDYSGELIPSPHYNLAVNALAPWQPETSGKIVRTFVEWLRVALGYGRIAFIREVLDKHRLFDFSSAEDELAARPMELEGYSRAKAEFEILERDANLYLRLSGEVNIGLMVPIAEKIEILRRIIGECADKEFFGGIKARAQRELRRLEDIYRLDRIKLQLEAEFEAAKYSVDIAVHRALLSRVPHGDAFDFLRDNIKNRIVEIEKRNFRDEIRRAKHARNIEPLRRLLGSIGHRRDLGSLVAEVRETIREIEEEFRKAALHREYKEGYQAAKATNDIGALRGLLRRVPSNLAYSSLRRNIEAAIRRIEDDDRASMHDEYERLRAEKNVDGLRGLLRRIPDYIPFDIFRGDVKRAIASIEGAERKMAADSRAIVAFETELEGAIADKKLDALRYLLARANGDVRFSRFREKINAAIREIESRPAPAPPRPPEPWTAHPRPPVPSVPRGDKVAEFNARLRELSAEYEGLKRRAKALGVEVSG
jgi:hypothetical protein